MNYEETFNNWQKTLASLSTNKIKAPNIPIHEFCFEAELLSKTAHKDKTKLLTTGLDWQLVEDLLPLSHTLRYYQAQWRAGANGKQKKPKQWQTTKSEALELRNEMLRHFKYAFYHTPDIKKHFQQIRKHGSNKDLIHDLHLLAKIAQQNAETLRTINYQTAQNTRARELSKALSELLAEINTSTNNGQGDKLWRDRAYTLLMNRVSITRECGRYIFWTDKKKLSMYASQYFRKHKK